MSINSPRGRSAAYRLPGVVALAFLGGGGIYAAHRSEEGKTQTANVWEAEATARPLQIHSSDTDIQLVPGTGKNVSVQWRASWFGEQPTQAVSTRIGVLQLKSTCSGIVRHFTGLFAFQGPCSVRYRIEVPAAQAVRLTVDSGDVALRNLRGHIDVQSTSGDISANGMRGGALVTL